MLEGGAQPEHLELAGLRGAEAGEVGLRALHGVGQVDVAEVLV